MSSGMTVDPQDRTGEITRAIEAKRVRLAEVEAREAALQDEQAAWEQRRIDADASGNERRLTEAEARLTAIYQAKRRAAATVAKLREELEALDRELGAERARTLAQRLTEAAAVAKDAARAFHDRWMTRLREECLPDADHVERLVAQMTQLEREQDHGAHRPARVYPRTLDQLAVEVPGALGLVRTLGMLARGEAMVLPPAGRGTGPQSGALARLSR